jgi:HEAT repeat-containing protein 5
MMSHKFYSVYQQQLCNIFAGFSSQLPHDGGAFYTSDTIEASRPHFGSAWPPLLHAAALWLTNGGGYQQLQQSDAPWNSKCANKQSADIAKDTYLLLFGNIFLQVKKC